MRTRNLLALLFVGALVAGCAPADDGSVAEPPDDPATEDSEEPSDDPPAEDTAEPSTLEITATDDAEGGGYAFELPASVESGATRLALTNTGGELHHAQLFRLNDDATMEDLGAQLATGDPTALLEVGVFDGGTGGVAPGGTSTADGVADLTEGSYAFMCFVENAEGVPHVAGGMLAPFQVTAAEEPVAMPEADAEVGLLDYAFDLPEELAGDAVLAVSNDSESEPHELNILQLAPDATVDDVLGMFEAEAPPDGPPPFTSVGGLNAILPGADSGLALDLEPGEYVFVCLIPSFAPENAGTPHAALGMVQQVTIE